MHLAEPALPDPPLRRNRRDEVLAAALDLLIAQGERFSMGGLAAAAACSKETLYKWFGDRHGLLTAVVQWQAAKVRMPEMAADGLDLPRFRAGLEAFATDWIGVISGEPSVALNRLAIAHAGAEDVAGGESLGAIVLKNGPRSMAARLAPILALGRKAGLIGPCDDEAAFTLFFGLVIGDLQIAMLLGDPARPDRAAAQARARLAVDRFLTLVGPPAAV
jgi:AcrR family transcriptional regulator